MTIRPPFLPLLLLLALLNLSACAVRQEEELPAPAPERSAADIMTEDIRDLLEAREIAIDHCKKADNNICREPCHRDSDAMQALTANEPPRKKTVKTAKNSSKKITVRGRCQPQCLIYARCRSGFMSCRLGNTTSLSWWPCARAQGLTSQVPLAGSVMLLGKQASARMRVGHAVYVEEVCALKDGRFLLRVSHANYDRRCSLDLDAKVLYDPRTRTADFLTGAWKKLARSLKALGFVTG
jgi:hypothetical protein